MKSYMLVSVDGTTAQWFRSYDPDTEPPLSELYEVAFVARLVEITGRNPMPQEGWLVKDAVKDTAGRIISATFNPPPGPTIEQLSNQLQELLHAYIYSHYDLGTQASLSALATALQLVLLNSASTQADKDAAQTKLAQIQSAWSWVASILTYYYGLKDQLKAGASWEALDLDFAKHFDGSNPNISLQTLIK